MALIKCPECGRENVSASAVMCPNCGYGINTHFEKIRQEEGLSEKRMHNSSGQGVNSVKAQDLKEGDSEESACNICSA